MVDNALIDPGTTPTLPVATDEIGGNHYQKMKLFNPTTDSTDPIGITGFPLEVTGTVTTSISNVTVDNAAGAAAVNIQDGGNSITIDAASLPLPTGAATEATLASIDGKTFVSDTDNVTVVSMPAVSGTVTVVQPTGTNLHAVIDSGTITANAGTDLNTSLLALESGGNLAGIRTAVEIIDNWNESDRAKVNPIAGQAGVQGASGTVSANTQRVVLATDVALPTGSNTIGSVASILTSIVPGTAATNLGKAEDAPHTSSDVGVMSLAVRNDTNATSTTNNGDYSTINVDLAGCTKIVGPAAHDAAKFGSPVLIGGVFNSTDPAVATGDISDLQVNTKGHLKSAVRREITTPTNIAATYNATTTQTSASIDVSNFRRGTFSFTLTKANTPTDIVIALEFSDTGTNWYKYRRDWWADYRFDDVIAGTTLSESMPFDIIDSFLRIVITATGTDATNTFTIANPRIQVMD